MRPPDWSLLWQWGLLEHGNDLRVRGNEDEEHLFVGGDEDEGWRCTSYLGRTYDLPAGQHGRTFLTGCNKFDLSEMEVFRVI